MCVCQDEQTNHINLLFLMHKGHWDSNQPPTLKFALPSFRSTPPPLPSSFQLTAIKYDFLLHPPSFFLKQIPVFTVITTKCVP